MDLVEARVKYYRSLESKLDLSFCDYISDRFFIKLVKHLIIAESNSKKIYKKYEKRFRNDTANKYPFIYCNGQFANSQRELFIIYSYIRNKDISKSESSKLDVNYFMNPVNLDRIAPVFNKIIKLTTAYTLNLVNFTNNELVSNIPYGYGKGEE